MEEPISRSQLDLVQRTFLCDWLKSRNTRLCNIWGQLTNKPKATYNWSWKRRTDHSNNCNYTICLESNNVSYGSLCSVVVLVVLIVNSLSIKINIFFKTFQPVFCQHFWALSRPYLEGYPKSDCRWHLLQTEYCWSIQECESWSLPPLFWSWWHSQWHTSFFLFLHRFCQCICSSDLHAKFWHLWSQMSPCTSHLVSE